MPAEHTPISSLDFSPVLQTHLTAYSTSPFGCGISHFITSRAELLLPTAPAPPTAFFHLSERQPSLQVLKLKALESSSTHSFPLSLHIPGLQIHWPPSSKYIQNPATCHHPGQDTTISHPALSPAKTSLPACTLVHPQLFQEGHPPLALLLLMSQLWLWSCLCGEAAAAADSYLEQETICRKQSSLHLPIPKPARGKRDRSLD